MARMRKAEEEAERAREEEERQEREAEEASRRCPCLSWAVYSLFIMVFVL